MVRSYDHTEQTAEEFGVDMRTAAQILAIKRVAAAVETRGIYP
jgi:glutamate dehydrogenase/leucine dehydrogenase